MHLRRTLRFDKIVQYTYKCGEIGFSPSIEESEGRKAGCSIFVSERINTALIFRYEVTGMKNGVTAFIAQV